MYPDRDGRVAMRNRTDVVKRFRYHGWRKGAMKAHSLISAPGKAEIWVTSARPTTTSDHIPEFASSSGVSLK